MTDATHVPANLADLLSAIVLILAVSGFIIPVLQIRKISSVVGYLLCGLILGPHALGLYAHDYPLISPFVITDTRLIHLLAELGVAFLLFTIGLELTFTRLWNLRKWVLGMGTTQIVLTALVIGVIAFAFDNTLKVSILIGVAFALSSTAIIMKLLQESHLIVRPVGRISFSVLLMQDLAVVPILVLVGAFSAGQGSGPLGVQLTTALVTAFLVVGAIILAGKMLLRPLLNTLAPAKNAEWLFAMILLLVIGCAALTESYGLSAALGAFLAGILIAETEYRHEVAIILNPVKSLFLGVFFMSVGMETDIAAVLQHPVWLPLSVIGIFFIKALCFYPVARLYGISSSHAAQASIYLAQCGEFAFLVIGLALAGGLLPHDDAQFFLLVSAVSLLLTPLTVRLAPLAGGIFESGEDSDKETEKNRLAFDEERENHVIIAGFGRVGQILADILEAQKIPYVAMDMNTELVSRFHAQGYPVVVGNAMKKVMWEYLRSDRAKAVVFTIDDFSATEYTIRYLRIRWPLLPIVVRARDHAGIKSFFDAGATSVVPEAYESSLRLVRILLEKVGVNAGEAENIVKAHRRQYVVSPRPEEKEQLAE